MAVAPSLPRPRRFAWGWGEVSGALGDLGTFLPHILGVIAVVAVSPVGVLSTFGLFYMATGLVYGIPVPVQPMKAASAVVLVQRLSPAEIAAAGLVLGLVFTVLAVSGLAGRLARLTPALVVSGIQVGVGVSLALLGARFMGEQPWLSLLVLGTMVAMLAWTRLPAALIAVALGSLLVYIASPDRRLPALDWGLHWPGIVMPTARDFLRATELAVLPQIPLTLTNALIVTSALARQLFPDRGNPAPVSRLSLTTGLGNLMAAPLGGYMMCHGSGGLAAHYRFGARTATAPVLLGATFLALGILLGESASPVLRLVPSGVLGALLFFSGLELASASGVARMGWRQAAFVLALGALGIVFNPAIAFGIGLALWYGSGWAKSGKKALRIMGCALLALVLPALSACGSPAGPVTMPTNPELVLATTTSTQDSGLLDVLIPLFEKPTGYRVKPIAVGSGQAMTLGERGEADVLLVHAPESEERFMAAGHGVDRKLVMHNDFVLVGPEADPAGVAGLLDAREALSRIVATRSTFISRGDNSGTHQLEKRLWREVGSDLVGQRWYVETGQGMGLTLNVASDKAAYTIADRGTYLALRKNLRLGILVEGDKSSLNIYHVIVVNPKKSERINYEGARAFSAFMVSPEAQMLIGEYGVDKYGQPLFFPDAGRPEY